MQVEFVRDHRIPKSWLTGASTKRQFAAGDVVDFDNMEVVLQLLGIGAVRQLASDVRAQFVELRQKCGIRPYDPHVYLDNPRVLLDARPGNRMLIIRKYGGLGDILISSYVLNELHKRRPDIEIHFATPGYYHCMFRGVDWLHLVDYDRVFRDYAHVRGGVIRSEVASEYDIVEDISTPCHIHENIHALHGILGMKRRSRIEMWGHWIGLHGLEDVETCIELTDKEVDRAGAKYLAGRGSRPLLLFAPFTNLPIKDFTHWFELAELLSKRFQVVGIGDPKKLAGIQSVHTGTDFRAFLSVIANADIVVSSDTSVFHAAAVVGVPCLGLFNFNDGETYCKHYPLADYLQCCPTPCIGKGADTCKRRQTIGGQCFETTTIKAASDLAQAMYERYGGERWTG